MAGKHQRKQAVWSYGFAVATAMMIEGCSKSDEANQSLGSTTEASAGWDWKPSPEMSVVAGGTTHLDNGSVGSSRRCWKRPSGYDCLYVGMSGPMFNAKRYQMRTLNKGYDDDPSLSSFAGYSCSFFPDNGIVEEHIAANGDFLTKNVISLSGQLPDSSPWSEDHVNSYLGQNSIRAMGTHFDCVELAAQVMSGSLNTVASTSVTYDQLMH